MLKVREKRNHKDMVKYNIEKQQRKSIQSKSISLKSMETDEGKETTHKLSMLEMNVKP
jgi:hypothetical protein